MTRGVVMYDNRFKNQKIYYQAGIINIALAQEQLHNLLNPGIFILEYRPNTQFRITILKHRI